MSKAPNSSKFIESWIAETEQETLANDSNDLDQDMQRAIELSKQSHQEEQARILAMFTMPFQSTSCNDSLSSRRLQKSIFDDDNRKDHVKPRSALKAANSKRSQSIPMRQSIEKLIGTHSTLSDLPCNKSPKKHASSEIMIDNERDEEEFVIEDVSAWLEETRSESSVRVKETITSSPPSSLIGDFYNPNQAVPIRPSFDSTASTTSFCFGDDKGRQMNPSVNAMNQPSSSRLDNPRKTAHRDGDYAKKHVREFSKGSSSYQVDQTIVSQANTQEDAFDQFSSPWDDFDQIDDINSKERRDHSDSRFPSIFSDQFGQTDDKVHVYIPDHDLDISSGSHSDIFGQDDPCTTTTQKPISRNTSSSPPSDIFGYEDQYTTTTAQELTFRKTSSSPSSDIFGQEDHNITMTQKSISRKISSSPPSGLFGQEEHNITMTQKSISRNISSSPSSDIFGQDYPKTTTVQKSVSRNISSSPPSGLFGQQDRNITTVQKLVSRNISSSPPSGLFRQKDHNITMTQKSVSRNISSSPPSGLFGQQDRNITTVKNPVSRNISSSPPSDLLGQIDHSYENQHEDVQSNDSWSPTFDSICGSGYKEAGKSQYAPRQLSSSPPSDLFGQTDYTHIVQSRYTPPRQASSPPLDLFQNSQHDNMDSTHQDPRQISSGSHGATSGYNSRTRNSISLSHRTPYHSSIDKVHLNNPDIPFSAQKRSFGTLQESVDPLESSSSLPAQNDENKQSVPKEPPRQKKHRIINPFKLDPIKPRRPQPTSPPLYNTEDVVGDFLNSWLNRGKIPVFSQCTVCLHSFPDEVLHIHAATCKGGFNSLNDEDGQTQRTSERQPTPNERSLRSALCQEDDKSTASTFGLRPHRERPVVRQNRTIARSVARQDRRRSDRNETPIAAANYYAEDDSLEGVEGGDFGASIDGLAWESMGHTTYN
ncbi:hypothetical protein CLU79DRAFT_829932 [Phycomyces nitens]|nr:hypothetical protein CLU79DRAFT_829932 [Phycomyces nitens]